MRWISITGLCRVDPSCPPSLRGLVGQHTVAQGPDLGEAGFGGTFVPLHCGCDVGRSPAARGSGRLRMFISVLTVLVLRPQILLAWVLGFGAP